MINGLLVADSSPKMMATIIAFLTHALYWMIFDVFYRHISWKSCKWMQSELSHENVNKPISKVRHFFDLWTDCVSCNSICVLFEMEPTSAIKLTNLRLLLNLLQNNQMRVENCISYWLFMTMTLFWIENIFEILKKKLSSQTEALQNCSEIEQKTPRTTNEMVKTDELK